MKFSTKARRIIRQAREVLQAWGIILHDLPKLGAIIPNIRGLKLCLFSWLLVSEPGFLKVLGEFGRTFKFILKLRPRSNILSATSNISI